MTIVSDTMYQKWIALISMSILCISLSVATEGLLLEFDIYRNDSVVFHNVTYQKNATVSHFPAGRAAYSIAVQGGEQETLFEDNIGAGFTVTGRYGGVLNKTEKHIVVPYYQKAQTIELSQQGRTVKTIELADHLCNRNTVCEEHRGESSFNCPEDCSRSDGVSQEEEQPIWLYTLIAGVVIIGAAIVLAIIKRE